ncbi:ABC transporter permease [Streptomyces sp. ACT015]|uniref:ABC transporter permease n=1 Tax=Streptomyces sp. ACT015 TaxID=3134807 RepID=UPI003D1666F2
MTATLLPQAPAAERTGPARTFSAVLALALLEGRRLLLSPPVLAALAAFTAWTVWRTPGIEDGHPALQDVDRATQGGPLLVALAVMLSVNHAVLRSKYRDTERHFSVLALGPGARTAAHALSLLPVALVTAVGVLAHFGYAALLPDAVGHGSPAELAVGPLTVLLFGAFGVLLARVVRSVAAAPIALVLLFLLFVAGALPVGDDERGTRWLLPIVSEPGPVIFPSDLLGRPAAWHALYLAGLTLVLGTLAVVRAGARGPLALGGLAVAVALAVTGGVLQTGTLPADVRAARERATLTPEKVQSCVRHTGTTYCAYPEWIPRTDRWAQVVDRIREASGVTASDPALVVRQRIDARFGPAADTDPEATGTPHQVTVGTSWGGNRVPEFAADVAGVLVAGDETKAGRICDGRAVTVMWLALSALPDPVGSLRDVRLDDSDTGSALVLSQTEPHSMTEAQTEVVRDLLDRPRAQVATRVKAHWTELTAPGITAAEAAGLLGAPKPQGDDKCED